MPIRGLHHPHNEHRLHHRVRFPESEEFLWVREDNQPPHLTDFALLYFWRQNHTASEQLSQQWYPGVTESEFRRLSVLPLPGTSPSDDHRFLQRILPVSPGIHRRYLERIQESHPWLEHPFLYRWCRDKLSSLPSPLILGSCLHCRWEFGWELHSLLSDRGFGHKLWRNSPRCDPFCSRTQSEGLYSARLVSKRFRIAVGHRQRNKRRQSHRLTPAWNVRLQWWSPRDRECQWYWSYDLSNWY